MEEMGWPCVHATSHWTDFLPPPPPPRYGSMLVLRYGNKQNAFAQAYTTRIDLSLLSPNKTWLRNDAGSAFPQTPPMALLIIGPPQTLVAPWGSFAAHPVSQTAMLQCWQIFCLFYWRHLKDAIKMKRIVHSQVAWANCSFHVLIRHLQAVYGADLIMGVK